LHQAAVAALGISPETLARAARRDGQPLADALGDAGVVDPVDWARALAAAAGLPFASTPPALPPPALPARPPMGFAPRPLVPPPPRDAQGVEVAIAAPAALAPLDDLRFLYRAPLRPLVVPAPALRDAITRAYDAATGSAADTMEAIGGERLVV